MLNTIKVLATVVVLLYLAYLALLFVLQRSILFPGSRIAVDTRPPVVPDMEVMLLPTSAGTAEALFLPATGATPGQRQPAMIFAHGNGEVTDSWTSALNGFRERGIGVLLVEYPGYGRSQGKPSEAAIRSAMDSAYDRLLADPRVDPGRIFGFGQSLGGGAICVLARDRPLRGLILQSTFTSLAIFPRRYWAPAFLLRDRFDNLAAVKGFAGPVLVIHGRNDPLIPWQQGQRLAAASQHATFKLYDCAHGCWDPDRLPFWQDALPFLVQAGILQGQGANKIAGSLQPDNTTGAHP